MKPKYVISALILSLAATTLPSCEDMMDVKSDSYVFDEDNNLNTANDSLYSAMGILAQMQKIGERYVLLGELRGDLATVGTSASVSLQEISSFSTTPDNEYNSRRDYYSIINNCNYALARMDTAIVEGINKVMLPEYTAIRTLRDWTYFQMGLAYGSVKYIEAPILSLEDSEMDYPVITLEQLVDRLIADLEPLGANTCPDYGVIESLDSRTFFIQPRLLLADLYLFQNRYADAARMYYDYIDNNSLTLSNTFANTWATSQALAIGSSTFLSSYRNEAIFTLPYPRETKYYHPDLINLTYNAEPQIVPAPWWIKSLETKPHFHIDREGITSISGYLEGDLRGYFNFAGGTQQQPVSAGYVRTGSAASTSDLLITKFYNTATVDATLSNPSNPMMTGQYITELPLYRAPHVYLRYAEAVNRMGKPTLAFAVLKYGLRAEVVSNPEMVNPSELEDGLVYTNFTNTTFDTNRGTASRGRGLGIALDKTDYVIPQLATLQDSIQWVENEIADEMAAETQYEGNRFFDLVRIARHRTDYPAYFAEKVSRRFDNPEAAKAILMNQENWWLK